MKTPKTLLSVLALTGLTMNLAYAGPDSLALDDYGISLNIDLVKMPLFPNSLVSEGYLEGDVQIVMEINHDGELNDWMVIKSTHPDFVSSIENVIDHWRFSAPYINGENRSVVSHLHVHFESKSSVISFNSLGSANTLRFNQLTGFESESTRLARIKELDTLPYPISQPSPSIPSEVMEKFDGTRAVFTFYVDETGQVRIPALAQTDGEPDLGMVLAAQDALTQWRFEPPTKNKRPAKIQLSQTFVFKK